jgi:3-oxoacyl-[acyl-carrier-protein] synthase-3
MKNAVMKACGMAVPQRVVTNTWMNDQLGEDVDTWLREHVEIYERRWLGKGESTADLCVAAARQTLEKASVRAEQLDLIIIATDTPEYISPSTASVVQDRLGASRAGTFDLNTACAGFVTALDVGAKYIIADDQYTNVLIVGAYGMSKYLNLQDKKTVTLFGDGAGAALLCRSSSEDRGFMVSELQTQGQYSSWMGIYAGGTREPITPEAIEGHRHQLQFVKKFPPELNPEQWSAATLRLCERAGVTPDDIDQFFITQINVNSIRQTMDILHQPHTKAHTIMHRYGYTGSACIPMALNDAFEKGIVRPGNLVAFLGSGGGLAFASALFRL